MTGSRAIPPTRFGAAYRTFLIVAGLLAIVGIADAGRALFWLILDATTGADTSVMALAKAALRGVAWSLLAAAAYAGWRRTVLPATWIVVSIPILAWALLLAQRYS